MSETADPVDVLERELTILARQLTTPRSTECVFCYVDRMLEEFGCDNTLRWAVQWRGMRAPRATALEARLAQRGGYCDCEIFLNGWTPSAGAVGYDEESDEWRWREPRPPCQGARRGSSQPCVLWIPQRRLRW
jgi:hypothetical protein